MKNMAKNNITSLSMILWFFFFFHLAITPATCSNNEPDLQALLAFKSAINGGGLNSWNETSHYCSWGGILCSQRHQNRVVSINLMSQGLTGSISPHIGNLSFLRTIILQNNSFHGQIPEEIGRLRRLEMIEFSNNSFSGEIPRNLSQCRNLYYLNMIDNDLTGIIFPEIGSLIKLEALGLSENNLSGNNLRFVGNLTSLVLLSLANCDLEGDISNSLIQLQRLEVLNLDENRLTGTIPSGLFNISSISTFSMRSNRLQGTLPSDIGFTLPNMRFFSLADNHLNGVVPNSLLNSSSLEIIYLNLNNFTGQIINDFSRLSSLRSLELSFNHLEGDIGFISSMTNCTSLEVLGIPGNLLTGSLPDSISNLSTNLRYLSIARNQLSGTIPSGIGNLVGLNYLSIENNYVEGPIPSGIGKLNKLQEIYLGGNRLTNEIPFPLGNLTLLNHLYLGGNEFYGNIPQSLSNCTNLLTLDLSDNNLNGSIPPQIISLSSISISFNLSYNALTGSIPSEVGFLRNLVNLNLSHNRLSGTVPGSMSSCIRLELLRLNSNYLSGEIPDGLRALRGLQELDLSHNNLSGLIPSFLSEMPLISLNLSFNRLQGEVPTLGLFQNESAISLEGNNGLCGGISHFNFPPCPSKIPKKTTFSTLLKILIPTVGGGVILLLLCFYVFIYRRRISKRTQSSMPVFEAEYLRLSYADLLKATGGFSQANLIGLGKFGSVYKGILEDGKSTVAIKVLKLDVKGASRSFLAECNALRGIRHRNLVKILSICPSIDYQGNDFKALVYEFKSNGSLEKWLHQDEESSRINLGIVQRLSIATDVASALEYLHCGTDSSIVHGDLKPSNILLDENMTAHLGDFGLAKVISSIYSTHESTSVAIKGTIGYIPPEYGMSDMVSTAGDVYSFGIFLLEIFTNRRPTDGEGLHDFVSRALPSQVMDVVDPFVLLDCKQHKMNSSTIENCMFSLLEVGLACSKELPGDRMLMKDVVTELRKIKNAYMMMT